MLISNCAKSGCHDAASHEDDVVLNNYSNVMSTGDVDAFRADHSKIYEMITETDPDKKMPPAGQTALRPDQVALIFKWIEQGAFNNTCSDGCDTNNVTFSGTIMPLLQTNCVGCHSGGLPAGQINLSHYQDVLPVVQNGKLLGAVNHAAGFQPMPRGGNKLEPCKIDQIRIWIESGAQND
jgi:mono/diheme cytochrome c family protein